MCTTTHTSRGVKGDTKQAGREKLHCHVWTMCGFKIYEQYIVGGGNNFSGRWEGKPLLEDGGGENVL